MRLVVGRVGRPHGLRGEVTVEVRTDAAEIRFAPGAVLHTDPADRGPLSVAATRDVGGRLVVAFDGVTDRTAAEALRNTYLAADSATAPPLSGPDDFWDHELIGLHAHTPTGDPLGEVTDVLHPPGSDLLAIRRPDGAELLVPFVASFVPVVDVPGGRLTVDPPAGLLEL